MQTLILSEYVSFNLQVISIMFPHHTSFRSGASISRIPTFSVGCVLLVLVVWFCTELVAVAELVDTCAAGLIPVVGAADIWWVVSTSVAVVIWCVVVVSLAIEAVDGAAVDDSWSRSCSLKDMCELKQQL